jgi:hypothetical protein
MITIEQCLAYSSECEQLGKVANTSIQRATILFGISRTWTILANQMKRFDEVLRAEGAAVLRHIEPRGGKIR